MLSAQASCLEIRLSFYFFLFFFVAVFFFFFSWVNVTFFLFQGEERRKKGQKGGGRGKEVGREWGTAGSEASGVKRAEFRGIDEKH